MASPFSIFRRHQKAMLAVLTLLAMFAFVFLEPLLGVFRGDAPTNPVVVATQKHGDLREQDLHNLISQRQIVRNVLERTLIHGEVHPTLAGFHVQQLFGPPTEDAVVNAWLFAQQAEELGMVVEDRAVTEFLTTFLEQATEGRVRVGDVAEILRRDNIPQRVLFTALRRELLARQLGQSFRTSLYAVPPMERWDYYLRLNRRATVELVPVPVVDFTDDVDSPGERVLRAFFEEHKERAWRPDTPQPGFRQPRKVALQYFKAELDDFVDPDAVTDEEVHQYYEENKDALFRQPGTLAPEETEVPDPQGDESTIEPPAVPADEESMKPPVEQPADEPAAEPESPDRAPTEGSTTPPPNGAPAGEETETAEKAEQPAEPTEDPSEEPEEPGEEPTEAPENSDGAVPQRSDEDAAARLGTDSSRFVFTSFAEDAAGENDVSRAGPAMEAAEPAPEPSTPEVAEAAPRTANDPAAPERSTIDEPPAAPTQHRPLSEVEEEIRHTLARRQAHETIEQLLRSLSVRMQRYHDELTLYEVRREDDPTATPPAKLDMGNLAAEHNLKSFETPLISPWEARTLDVGESLIDGSEPFIRRVFEELPPFQPAISQSEQAYFLFWKTEQREESVPEWDDQRVQEQVLEAWKLVEARDSARSQAEELAARAREAGKTLEEFFAGDSQHGVVQAGPFSWMTYGDVPPTLSREPPRISEVEGVDFAGHRFMRDVFALDENELGVTMNQPETFAYVVRMASLAPSRSVLWEGFLVDSFDKYEAARLPNLRQMQAAWQQELEEAAGLQWKRSPWRGRGPD